MITSLPRKLKLFALLITLAASSTHAQAAGPIIAEYTFEDIPAYIPGWGAGYKGSYKPATGWKTPFSVKLDKNDPHFGLACTHIEFTTGIEDIIRIYSPAIPVPEELRGESIRVEAYVRGQNIHPQNIGLGILQKDAQAQSIGYVGLDPMLTPIPSATDWQKITLEGTLNTKAVHIILMLTVDAAIEPSHLWIDNILVLPAN